MLCMCFRMISVWFVYDCCMSFVYDVCMCVYMLCMLLCKICACVPYVLCMVSVCVLLRDNVVCAMCMMFA